jgi:hypothetical protein
VRFPLRVPLVFVLLPVFFLAGCATPRGGSAARFTPQNFQEIALSPYYLSDPAEGGDHAWYMKLKRSRKAPVAGFLKPNEMLTESLTRSIYGLKLVAGQVLPPVSLPAIHGCAGSYATQINIQPGGEISGHLLFSGYADDCSLALEGRVPFKGKLDPASGDTRVELTLSSLAGRLAAKGVQLSGKLELEFNALVGEQQLVTASSSMNIADETGLRMSLRPMSFSWDRRGQYLQEIIEGQVAISPYGVLQLKTTSPLKISPERNAPFEGALRFYGENDSSVRMLFAKPGFTGFFILDGPDGFTTMGQI